MERAWLYKPDGLETRTLNSSELTADLCFHQSPPLGLLKDRGVCVAVPAQHKPAELWEWGEGLSLTECLS